MKHETNRSFSKRIIGIMLSVACVLTCLPTQVYCQDASNDALLAIENTEAALAKALEYFSKYESAEAWDSLYDPTVRNSEIKLPYWEIDTTYLTTFSDTIVPFMSDTMVGKAVWQIELSNVRYVIGKRCNTTYSCSIVIDSATGRFIQAIFAAEADSNYAEMPNRKYWEQQLKNQIATFKGYPDSISPHRLVDSFEGTGYSSLCDCREVVVWLLDLSKPWMDSRPVWCIVYRPVWFERVSHIPGEESPDGVRVGNTLVLVDASNGALISIATVK